MSLLHHTRNRPADWRTQPDPAVPAARAVDPTAPAPAGAVHETRAVPVTRTSVAWVGVWAAAITLVAFIVFILQNTHDARISFLWLHGTLPLAVGLLIATVAGIVVTMVLGTARITQLRRLARRRRD